MAVAAPRKSPTWACAIVFSAQAEVLLVQVRDGTWRFPAQRIRTGQTPWDALSAKQGLRQETGFCKEAGLGFDGVTYLRREHDVLLNGCTLAVFCCLWGDGSRNECWDVREQKDITNCVQRAQWTDVEEARSGSVDLQEPETGALNTAYDFFLDRVFRQKATRSRRPVRGLPLTQPPGARRDYEHDDRGSSSADMDTDSGSSDDEGNQSALAIEQSTALDAQRLCQAKWDQACRLCLTRCPGTLADFEAGQTASMRQKAADRGLSTKVLGAEWEAHVAARNILGDVPPQPLLLA